MLTTKILKNANLWLWGGFVYYVIELAYRGFSHPTMFIVGGLCFLIVGLINVEFPWDLGLLWQSLIGAAMITGVELIAGIILNMHFGLNVWDYSEMPLNLFGQICLPFFFAWIPVAAVGVWLDDFLRWKLYGEQKPRYKLF